MTSKTDEQVIALISDEINQDSNKEVSNELIVDNLNKSDTYKINEEMEHNQSSLCKRIEDAKKKNDNEPVETEKNDNNKVNTADDPQTESNFEVSEPSSDAQDEEMVLKWDEDDDIEEEINDNLGKNVETENVDSKSLDEDQLLMESDETDTNVTTVTTSPNDKLLATEIANLKQECKIEADLLKDNETLIKKEMHSINIEVKTTKNVSTIPIIESSDPRKEEFVDNIQTDTNKELDVIFEDETVSEMQNSNKNVISSISDKDPDIRKLHESFESVIEEEKIDISQTENSNIESVPDEDKIIQVDNGATNTNRECKIDNASVENSSDINKAIDRSSNNDDIFIENTIESLNNSQNSSTQINTEHGLNKPNAMIEIPSDLDMTLDSMNQTCNLNTEDESFDKGEKNTDNTQTNQTAIISSENIIESSDTLSDVKTKSVNVKNDAEILYKKTLTNTEANSGVPEELQTKSLSGMEKPISALDSCMSESKDNIDITAHNELDVQPSTSKAVEKNIADATDEVPEMSDSLGLLAESFHVMDDDEEQEQDDDEADGDEDDDDFEQDDESNLMTAEHSEDSNQLHTELDIAKDHVDMDVDSHEQEEKESKERDSVVDDTSNIESEATEKDVEMEIDVIPVTEELEVTSPGIQTGPDNVEPVQVEQPESHLTSGTVKKDEIISTETVETTKEHETIKISGTPDVEVGSNEADEDNESKLKKILLKKQDTNKKKGGVSPAISKLSPSKTVVYEISKPEDIDNIVEVEDSEDETLEVETSQPEPQNQCKPSQSPNQKQEISLDELTTVKLPDEIEVMCSTGSELNKTEMITKEGEVVISGIPKPKACHVKAILNTGEIRIKTTTRPPESPLIIPEAKMNQNLGTQRSTRNLDLEEVFNLDSDEEDSTKTESASKEEENKENCPIAPSTTKTSNEKPPLCVNYKCTSDSSVEFFLADAATLEQYDAKRSKRTMVCAMCAVAVAERLQGLVEGIKSMMPILDLNIRDVPHDLVEISDSDSEEEIEEVKTDEPKIGMEDATVLEDKLVDILNDTWIKYRLEERLKDTQDTLSVELDQLEKESKELNDMLNECQVATDKLRNEFYGAFERSRVDLPPLIIYNTPDKEYVVSEECESSRNQTNTSSSPAAVAPPPPDAKETRLSKRRMSSASETPAKRPAIPMGYTPLDADAAKTSQGSPSTLGNESKDDDNVDISVVKLSVESAPAGLPPPGEVTRSPLRVGMMVYGMRNAFGSWLKAKVVEITGTGIGNNGHFTMCRVRFEHKVKNPCKVLPARCLAYSEPTDVRLTIGTRVIALCVASAPKRASFYSGVIAEIPNPVNDFRYLVFFDDGYAQYVQHANTRLVCECSALVWEEVHPFSREFVMQYLLAYPERPMVRLHAGQKLKTEWNGKWWVCTVVKVDASLVQVYFKEDNRTEWIYRGSTRLAPLFLEFQAAERHRNRPMPRSTSNKGQPTSNMPYVEYTRSEEQTAKEGQQREEELRRQRAVARKSTSGSSTAQQQQTQQAPAPAPTPAAALDGVTSRVVYYTPKNAVKPYKMVPHNCSTKCRRTDVLALKDLRTYNPLAKPLLSGWERQIVRYRFAKQVMYRAPCGRRLRNMQELHAYLCLIHSDMGVELFDFHPNTHCLAEFVLNKCIVSKKDLSHGKENVPVPCVNYYDDALPEFCSYNTERTPTAGVPLNLDPDFLCGCDCTDDCQDKTKCACWKMTLEGARTIGLDEDSVGYVYKRLPEPLQSGIYECNVRCKCRATCLNRVAQHPLQLKLQVFKTMNRGWGIRALNDVPKGSFLCVYAGNLLTDATANLDGLNEGDEYLAELDYIEVVEQMKEGYEEDIPDSDKQTDKDGNTSSSEDGQESSADEDKPTKSDEEDGDFMPSASDVINTTNEFRKSLRKRDKTKKKAEREKEKEEEKKPKEVKGDDDCITISDDEEVREPSRFMAEAGIGANEFKSKYKSVRAWYGKDEACYIVDAKVQGNIGRYLNHSCTPNVFVQNVFVDTHDPRFPWVAFFALSHIRAGTELTWNYNYDIGSVPEKVLYCYCGASNCRGRLL